MTLQEVLQDVQKAAEAVKLSIEAKIEDDQIICDGVYLSETQVAKKTLRGAKYVPGYGVSVGHYMPSYNRDIPDDYDVVEVGEATENVDKAIVLFLQTIIERRAKQHFDSLANAAFSEMLAEEEQKSYELQMQRLEAESNET